MSQKDTYILVKISVYGVVLDLPLDSAVVAFNLHLSLDRSLHFGHWIPEFLSVVDEGAFDSQVHTPYRLCLINECFNENLCVLRQIFSGNFNHLLLLIVTRIKNVLGDSNLSVTNRKITYAESSV